MRARQGRRVIFTSTFSRAAAVMTLLGIAAAPCGCEASLGDWARRFAGGAAALFGAEPGQQPNCSEPAHDLARALRHLDICGFVVMPQVIDPAAVRRFGADFRAFASEHKRFTALATAPQPGTRITDRVIVQVPGDDPRFAFERVRAVVASTPVIALLDAYYNAHVDFDGFTVIRNHGCQGGTRPRCQREGATADNGDGASYASSRGDGQTEGGYLWLSGERNGYHTPCCANKDQDYHRDLDNSGAITVNIPLAPQREGFGPVRFCVMNATGQGTHVAAEAARLAARDTPGELDVLFDPWGYVNEEEAYMKRYNDDLVPLCQNEEDGGEPVRGGRRVVTPHTSVGDVSVYDATAMHKGTSNWQSDDRDVVSLTFVWRGCPAGATQSPEWRCAECFHCADKTGWAESKFGVDGHDGQRLRLAENYARQQARVRGALAQLRQGTEYAEAARAMSRTVRGGRASAGGKKAALVAEPDSVEL